MANPGTPSTLDDDRVDLPDSWIFDGIVAGLIGAAIVSIIFLGVDLMGGQALRTPASLGAAVFLGDHLAPGAAISGVLVTGYTVLHGAVFVTFGLAAAYSVLQLRHGAGPLFGLALAAALFVGLEVFFLAFLGVFSPSLIGVFGTGNIATANLLAAGGMASTTLALSVHRHGAAEPPHAHAHA